MGSFPPTDVDTLWHRWRRLADSDARAELIEHYLPLVSMIVARMARSVPFSLRVELDSYGAMGLIDAVDKFRPELGNRFETYGSCRIRGAIHDGLRTLNWFPRGAWRRPGRVIENIVTIDFQSARTGTGARLQDSLADRSDGAVPDELLLDADHAEVADAIEDLPARERLVVVAHYYDGRKLADIGRELGVTESRVCQLHRRALKMLQENLLSRLSA